MTETPNSVQISLFIDADTEVTYSRIKNSRCFTVNIGCHPLRLTVFLESDLHAHAIADAFKKAGDEMREDRRKLQAAAIAEEVSARAALRDDAGASGKAGGE